MPLLQLSEKNHNRLWLAFFVILVFQAAYKLGGDANFFLHEESTVQEALKPLLLITLWQVISYGMAARLALRKETMASWAAMVVAFAPLPLSMIPSRFQFEIGARMLTVAVALATILSQPRALRPVGETWAARLKQYLNTALFFPAGYLAFAMFLVLHGSEVGILLFVAGLPFFWLLAAKRNALTVWRVLFCAVSAAATFAQFFTMISYTDIGPYPDQMIGMTFTVAIVVLAYGLLVLRSRTRAVPPNVLLSQGDRHSNGMWNLLVVAFGFWLVMRLLLFFSMHYVGESSAEEYFGNASLLLQILFPALGVWMALRKESVALWPNVLVSLAMAFLTFLLIRDMYVNKDPTRSFFGFVGLVAVAGFILIAVVSLILLIGGKPRVRQEGRGLLPAIVRELMVAAALAVGYFLFVGIILRARPDLFQVLYLEWNQPDKPLGFDFAVWTGIAWIVSATPFIVLARIHSLRQALSIKRSIFLAASASAVFASYPFFVDSAFSMGLLKYSSLLVDIPQVMLFVVVLTRCLFLLRSQNKMA
jgi:hypothetical protein